MRTSRIRSIASLILIATLSGPAVVGAEVDAPRLEVGPPCRLSMSVLFAPTDDEIRLEVRAVRVTPSNLEEPAQIKARGAEHRDADGFFRVEQVVRKGDANRQDVLIPIDPGAFDLPEGPSDVGLILKGLKGDGLEFLAAIPLARVEVEGGVAQFLGGEALTIRLPEAAPDAKEKPRKLPTLNEFQIAVISRQIAANAADPEMTPTQIVPSPVPPDPGMLLPSPQAPSKVQPAPVAPSKVMPAPMAPSKVLPAPMAPAGIPPSPGDPALAVPKADYDGRPTSGGLLGPEDVRVTMDDLRLRQAESAARVQPNIPLSAHETRAERRYIYFATNRKPIPGTLGLDLNKRFSNDLAPGNTLTFGSCPVNVPIWIDGKFRPNGDLPVQRIGNMYKKEARVFYTDPPNELSWEQVHEALKRVGPVGENDILVLVHGFNNTMEAAALRLAQVAQDTGFLGRSVLFSWPSDGTFLLSIKDLRHFPETSYARDGRMAAESGKPLADLLRRLIRTQGEKQVAPGQPTPRVHVIAHSMGNRVLLDAMQKIAADTVTPGKRPLGHVVLAAPDVATAQFKKLAPTAAKVADDVTLYYNPDDWALLSSHYIANGESRVGEDGVFDTLGFDLDRVDASKASTNILGHDYAMSGNRLLMDLRLLLRDNLRVAERKATLSDKVFNPGDFAYWLFP